MEKETRRWKTALGLMLAGLVVWAMLASGEGGNSKDVNRMTVGEATGGQDVVSKLSGDPADSCADPTACREANRKAYARAGKPSWSYSDGRDEMRQTKIRVASIESPEKLDFPFPYNGGSTATLRIQKHKNQTTIWLAVDKGQLLCSFTGDTVIPVKFDSGKVQEYRCLNAQGGASNTFALQPASRFLSKLKASKKVIIEATFFRSGARQIGFEVEGLDWK